jgi:AcrR family transcriptional regulator
VTKSAVLDCVETLPVKPGRQELRTKETRELLLRAAKVIFIRDGYEGADLKDIAELADRTKGAIYGHFKSKEEIFLALIADHRQEYRSRLDALMSDDPKKNIAVLRNYVISLAEDRDWALLMLEFKMFALRHPETKAQFQSLYEPARENREETFARLVGPAGKGKQAVSRSTALASLFPMLSSLLLEAEFEPGAMSTESIKKVIAEVFDCLVST